MKVTFEFALVILVVLTAVVVSLALVLEHIWPILVLVYIGYMIYRHKYPKPYRGKRWW